MGADMPAFSDLEKRIIGNIVRYHRRALPSPKHSSFALLNPGDQETVKKLASFLRLADGLDDTHNARITDLEFISGNGEITFRAQTGDSCPEEIDSIERKKDLFVQTYGKNFRLTLQDNEAQMFCMEAAEQSLHT